MALGHGPAAADRLDERGVQVLGQVVVVDAAGGDELQTDEGAGERLKGFESAVHAGREELDDLQAVLERHHDLGGRDAAGRHRNVVFAAPGHGLLVIAGGDDELRAALDGQLGLLHVHDGAGADQHLGHFLRYGADSSTAINLEPNREGYSYTDAEYREKYKAGPWTGLEFKPLTPSQFVGLAAFNMGNLYLDSDLRRALTWYRMAEEFFSEYPGIKANQEIAKSRLPDHL